MIDAKTLHEIALSLPEAHSSSDEFRFGFGVRDKGFAWSWSERVDPKKPRIPRLDVLAVRCARAEKETILASDPEVFVTEPHYNGFPAVLVRLDRIEVESLSGLLRSAWMQVAPKALVKQFLSEA